LFFCSNWYILSAKSFICLVDGLSQFLRSHFAFESHNGAGHRPVWCSFTLEKQIETIINLRNTIHQTIFYPPKNNACNMYLEESPKVIHYIAGGACHNLGLTPQLISILPIPVDL
jgi:hypothetical protein